MSLDHIQNDANGIILPESYVLRIRWVGNDVLLRVEWALAPSHPLYRAPSLDERRYWRNGTLMISGFEMLIWKSLDIDPAIDANGTVDLGQLSDIVQHPSGISVVGDWGEFEARGPVSLTLSISGPVRE